MNDRFENETGTEELLNLLTNDLVQILPPVEHGREHEDFEAGVVCLADRGDGFEKLVHSEKCKRTGVDGK